MYEHRKEPIASKAVFYRRIIVNIIVIIIVYDTLDLRCLVKYVRIQQIAIIGYLGGTAGFAAECATEHT